LQVIFAGEEGLDAGGVRKEFFTLITRQLFSPEFGMFVEQPDTRTLFFRPDSMEAPVNFELIGSLIGLAVYNAVILDLHLPLALYRKLKKEPLSLRDLDDWQPALARGLRLLLDYRGDDVEDVFALTFSVTVESWGETRTVDLVPGGASVPVTRANARDYVKAYLQWLLVDSVKTFFDAFERGFNAVVGGPALELFRPEELAEAVRGSPTLDFEALERGAQYELPYTSSNATVRNFWSVVHSLTDEEKKKFLHFSTGTDRAPLRGLGSIQFVVSREPDSDRLPSSHTCFNQIVIPEYPTREKLEAKLRAAIQQSEGFGLI
jgi:ubiquitin-protein ligase E3 A